MFGFNGVTNFLAFALVISLLVRLIYLLFVRHWNYFSDRNVVFERGYPVLGTIIGNQSLFATKSVPKSIVDIYNRHPNQKFIGMYEMGGEPSYMIRDLNLIRDITIRDFDHFVNHSLLFDKDLDPLLNRTMFGMLNQPWRDMRKTMSPLFTGSKMKEMLGLMIECANEFNAYIRSDILSKTKTDSLEYDVMDLMMRLTNDVIGSTAFGIQINTLKQPENKFYKVGKEIADAITSLKMLFLIRFPKTSKFLNLKLMSDQNDKFYRDVIHGALEEREQRNIVRNDMLHLLILAKEGKLKGDKETEQDSGFNTISEFIASKSANKLKYWTDDDLVAQCVVFFMAGFTPVATAFSFLCYELSLNPDIQKRLFEEIMETERHLNGEQLTYEALQNMKYMDMVVSELFRKWPPSNMLDRVVNKQYIMEDTDGSKVVLEPNIKLWIPVFAIHRDPKHFPKPDIFDPERFSDENKKHIHSCALLTFGNGPRNCIAIRYVFLTIKAIIYHIVMNFNIETSARTPIPFEVGGLNVLESVGGFYNKFTLRN